jgi:hypothetical protein
MLALSALVPTLRLFTTAVVAASALLVSFYSTPVFARSEVTCTRGDQNDRLPKIVRFKIVSESRIEAQAWSQKNVPSPKSDLLRLEVPGQEGVAIFSISGLLGVSGDAKLLVTRTGLKFHNVGSIIITNRTAGDISSYHCQ